MKRLDAVIIAVFIGAVPPIAGFLVGWWAALSLLPERAIPFAALGGLLVGFVIDMVFLRRWVRRAYDTGYGVWMALYLFYSVGLFGLSMGVPVLNVLLGVPAGLYVGARLAHEHADQRQTSLMARCTALFTTAVLGLVCSASALLALLDPYTAANLEGMLGLGFRVTQPMIIGIIAIGGLALLVLEWWLTHKAVERTARFLGARRSLT